MASSEDIFEFRRRVFQTNGHHLMFTVGFWHGAEQERGRPFTDEEWADVERQGWDFFEESFLGLGRDN